MRRLRFIVASVILLALAVVGVWAYGTTTSTAPAAASIPGAVSTPVPATDPAGPVTPMQPGNTPTGAVDLTPLCQVLTPDTVGKLRQSGVLPQALTGQLSPALSTNEGLAFLLRVGVRCSGGILTGPAAHTQLCGTVLTPDYLQAALRSPALPFNAAQREQAANALNPDVVAQARALFGCEAAAATPPPAASAMPTPNSQPQPQRSQPQPQQQLPTQPPQPANPPPSAGGDGGMMGGDTMTPPNLDGGVNTGGQ